jgi:hypothetical protein
MIKFSNQHSTIEDINQFYFYGTSSLRHYFDEQNEYFWGYSKAELEIEFNVQLSSLERMVSLEILSLLEASFRIDYLRRNEKKLKDQLSKNLRATFKKKGNKASLDEDILKEWKVFYPKNKPLFDKFQKALDYRHWLAHGRYWELRTFPEIIPFDYLSIQLLASEILKNVDFQKL